MIEKKITRVRWSAENLPWGVTLDETNGTLSGTPEDAGEYVVPMTVETNYGKDTKDVVITVKLPTYGVYAIGQKALTWSENAEPDEYGFYKLSMPTAYTLVAHYNGFGAFTAEKDFWICGPYTVNLNNRDYDSYRDSIISSTKPVRFNDQEFWLGLNPNDTYTLRRTDRIIFVDYNCRAYTSIDSTTRVAVGLLYWSSELNAGICAWSRFWESVTYRDTGNRTLKNVSIPTYIYDLCSLNYNDGEKGYDENSYAYCTMHAPRQCFNQKFKVSKYLEYPAKKVFQQVNSSGNAFNYISLDGYLDDNPDNFTHGVIKDAWEFSRNVCVLTTSNQLYEYMNNTQTWNLLGMYDVKKIELPNQNNLFILTNDGRLFHKGNAVTGLFDTAHETLTHIFPELTFKDFTFGGDTLTVLRE